VERFMKIIWRVLEGVMAAFVFVLLVGAFTGLWRLVGLGLASSIFVNIALLSVCGWLFWQNRKLRAEFPVARAEATTAPSLVYRSVSLEQYAKDVYDSPDAPRGQVRLGLPEFCILSQYKQQGYYPRAIIVAPTEDNGEVGVDIPVNFSNVCEVYFLLVAGNGYRVFEASDGTSLEGDGRVIGRIELYFRGEEEPNRVALRLGHNIRDWVLANQSFAVCYLKDEAESGVGQVWKCPHNRFILDMLTVRVGRPKTLDRIKISAQLLKEDDRTPFIPRFGRRLPTLQVVGITCGVSQRCILNGEEILIC
jgi:hypothetical protein